MITRRILIVLSLALNACTTLPSSLLEDTTTTTCPQKLQVQVAGKRIAESAPNPFHGLPNPEVSVQGKKFKISLNTEESGLIELSDVDTQQLHIGTLEGSQFQLTLSYSPNYKQCIHNKKDSKLMIVEQSSEKISGCFYGKFDCDGQTLEVTAPFQGKL